MMRIPILALAIMMLVSASACGSSAASVPTQPGSGSAAVQWTAVPTTGAAEGEEQACANPYYPVADGASWQYTLSGSMTGTLTRTVSNVKPDGFSDQQVLPNGTTLANDWECEDGILADRPELVYAQLIEPGAPAAQDTDNSGVTVPDNLGPAAFWNQDTTLQANGAQTNHVLIECTAGDIESVTVAAGTFDSLRTDCKVEQAAAGSGSASSTATVWYAQGIGIVKIDQAVKQGAHTTAELEAYHIP